MSRTTTKVESPEKFASQIADSLLRGKGTGLKRDCKLGPVSDEDRRRLQRLTGETVEVFNNRIIEKLRNIADKAANVIERKLDGDEFKTGELAFVLTSSIDKMNTLSGREQVQHSSVNIQVNNYGTAQGPSKAELLASLNGAKFATPVSDSPEPAIDLKTA